MEIILRGGGVRSLRRGHAKACLILFAWLLLSPFHSGRASEIILSQPSPFGPDYVQILATNCTDTNFSYVLQSSTNMLDWSSLMTNPFTTTYLPFVIGKPTETNFYQVVTIPCIPFPLFSMAITCRSNFNKNTKNCRVDSFDSSDTNYSSAAVGTLSNSTVWVYDPGKAKSGGDIGVNAGINGSQTLGSDTFNGHLFTGPGNQTNVVQIGPNGSIGDLAWSASYIGIESIETPLSWWLPNFSITLPDIAAPTFTGLGLPPPINGYVTLNGGCYTTTSSIGISNLLITAPTILWAQVGGSFGVTMANTNASLILYVGKATGSSTSLTLSRNGTMNSPGYARNLMIYGLPTCTSMDFHGNGVLNACIYAPNANYTGGGGGNTIQDTQGSIVVKSITLSGHWNFHYDESLKVNGPMR